MLVVYALPILVRKELACIELSFTKEFCDANRAEPILDELIDHRCYDSIIKRIILALAKFCAWLYCENLFWHDLFPRLLEILIIDMSREGIDKCLWKISYGRYAPAHV